MMPRYYDAARVIKSGVRVGQIQDVYPAVDADKVLVGVAYVYDPEKNRIIIRAPDLSDSSDHTIQKWRAYSRTTLRVDLFTLSREVVERLPECPAYQIDLEQRLTTDDIIE